MLNQDCTFKMFTTVRLLSKSNNILHCCVHDAFVMHCSELSADGVLISNGTLIYVLTIIRKKNPSDHVKKADASIFGLYKPKISPYIRQIIKHLPHSLDQADTSSNKRPRH